jgi:hypothetical protein
MISTNKNELMLILKQLQRTPPGDGSYLEMQKEVLEKVKHLENDEKHELITDLKKMKSQLMVYRPSYYRPDYFRLLTILINRLQRRNFVDIKTDILDIFLEVKTGIRKDHFPRYPSSYIKRLRTLLIEAHRSGKADMTELAELNVAVDEMVNTINDYEYENVDVDISSTRIKVSSRFTLGETQRSWSIELISPKLEYGGRTFLKREVLAHITRAQKPLSRGEIEEGIGKKIRYFGHIIQSLVRKYLVVPVPAENKYTLTGTGKKVGEIYVQLLEKPYNSIT